MCASARFIGVHISLTSGCKGLLLHRYLTGSGYTPPLRPAEEAKKGGGLMQMEKGTSSLLSTASHLAPIKECYGGK